MDVKKMIAVVLGFALLAIGAAVKYDFKAEICAGYQPPASVAGK